MQLSKTIHQSLPLVDEILAEWEPTIGEAFQGYKNHTYRMLHCCMAIYPCSESDIKKLCIAASFHDLGVWSAKTVDYLPPSIREAEKYLERNQLDGWREEICLLIDLHHKLRPVQRELAMKYPLLEVFRRADLADVSLGIFSGGVPKEYMAELKRSFPNAGFHKVLKKLGASWFKRHPFSRPPFLKW